MQHIKHLYWRSGFGLSPAGWQERKSWPVQRALEQIFREAREDNAITTAISEAGNLTPEAETATDKAAQTKQRALARESVATNIVHWIQLMAGEQGSSLKHRMMLFWHGHFACRVTQPHLALGQLAIFERYGLGKFRDLVLAISKDPAMIRYLNNQQNRKQRPNENFARELMELFTIGRGHYSEQDVKAAARAFTGWSSDRGGEFLFRPRWHDYGRKTFLGRTGNFNGDNIIDIILEQKETARFLTRKIYRYFVNEQIDESRVQELAEAFYRSDYDIGHLMYEIFSSDWFYEPKNMGNQIKSPVVLMAGMLRSLPTKFKNPLVLNVLQRALGQIVFNPPNVAGWPGGKQWIDNSTLLLRLNLPAYLLNVSDADIRPKDSLKSESSAFRTKNFQAQIDLSVLESWLDQYSPVEAARQLADYLIVRPVKLPTLLEKELARRSGVPQALPLLLLGIMSLPEYQLC